MELHSDPMLPDLYQVRSVHQDTYDTFTLTLTSQQPNRRFCFSPGQFNMLYAFGVGEVPISISGDPDQASALVHTIRAVGTVTKAMQTLRGGETMGVRGPFGSDWPIRQAKGKDIVLIAGGIGLAPLRPVIYYLLSHRHRYGQIAILYGARTPRDLLYTEQLREWRQAGFEVRVTVDNAGGDWRGDVGVVTKLIDKADFDPYGTIAMICGPEIMMSFTVKQLQKQGLRDHDIFVSMERNMKCAIGLCGHCQYGPHFICKDGPVFRYDQIATLFSKREI